MSDKLAANLSRLLFNKLDMKEDDYVYKQYKTVMINGQAKMRMTVGMEKVQAKKID
jgi:hypothetical protein